MKVPLIIWLLTGIPENIGMVYLAYNLLKEKIVWKKIIAMGITLAVSAYVVRLLPVAFGVHTIINIGLLFLMLNYYVADDLMNSLKVTVYVFITLIISESVFVSTLLKILDISFDMVKNSTYLRLLVALPHVFFIFTVAFLLSLYRNKACENKEKILFELTNEVGK